MLLILKQKIKNDKTIKLSGFKGKKVVLYFYPKDDTPGCTRRKLVVFEIILKF